MTLRARLAWVLVVCLLVPACASGSDRPSAGGSGSGGPGISGLVGQEAPDFALRDQFDRPQRLSDYRGKVILFTFVSSRCKDVCPLTAELLTRTQHLLGARARDTQLVAVNANFIYNTVPDVLVWSQQHRMTHRWLFLTGSESALMSVYRAYRVTPGSAHTTVVFLIDQRGRIRGVVPTAMRGSLDTEARALAKYVRLLA
jgi:protein SCO1